MNNQPKSDLKILTFPPEFAEKTELFAEKTELFAELENQLLLADRIIYKNSGGEKYCDTE